MISYSEEHRSDIMVEGNDQCTTAAAGTFRFIGSGDIMIDCNDKRLLINGLHMQLLNHKNVGIDFGPFAFLGTVGDATEEGFSGIHQS